jgi:hypothetical protein
VIDIAGVISMVQAHRDLQELKERLRAAEKDAERLEWCIENGRFPQFCSHTNTGRGFGWYMPDDPREYAEARVAIDQQRKIATGEDLGL